MVYNKTCVKRLPSNDLKLIFNTNYRLVQVKSIVEWILFSLITLPFVIKIFILSIFEWLFNTGSTEHTILQCEISLKDV